MDCLKLILYLFIDKLNSRYLAGGCTQYFLTPGSEKMILPERLSSEHR